jgi:hypothetical protein
MTSSLPQHSRHLYSVDDKHLYSVAGVQELQAEVERLRQGLFECAKQAGEDVSEGIPTFPDIVDWAVEAVRQLRIDADA